MGERRAIGALEDEIMSFLWAVGAPCTPSQVHEAIAPELAYTTVMTVLSRLWRKGLLERERAGRAFVYAPISSEEVHRAEAMRSTLLEAGDPDAVLSSFVEALDPGEIGTLRRLLRRKGTPS